jgi:hypothetical protein
MRYGPRLIPGGLLVIDNMLLPAQTELLNRAENDAITTACFAISKGDLICRKI